MKYNRFLYIKINDHFYKIDQKKKFIKKIPNKAIENLKRKIYIYKIEF